MGIPSLSRRSTHPAFPAGRKIYDCLFDPGKDRSMSDAKKASLAVLGASGYTGAELVRLLLRHPRAEIALLTADRRAGQAMRDVFPQFAPYDLPALMSIDGIDWKKSGLDLAFCALPHGTTQKVIED